MLRVSTSPAQTVMKYPCFYASPDAAIRMFKVDKMEHVRHRTSVDTKVSGEASTRQNGGSVNHRQASQMLMSVNDKCAAMLSQYLQQRVPRSQNVAVGFEWTAVENGV